MPSLVDIESRTCALRSLAKSFACPFDSYHGVAQLDQMVWLLDRVIPSPLLICEHKHIEDQVESVRSIFLDDREADFF